MQIMHSVSNRDLSAVCPRLSVGGGGSVKGPKYGLICTTNAFDKRQVSVGVQGSCWPSHALL